MLMRGGAEGGAPEAGRGPTQQGGPLHSLGTCGVGGGLPSCESRLPSL